ncbi:MAG: hypothetical protein R3C19_07410 [Planctomycetaceae bacterium]
MTAIRFSLCMLMTCAVVSFAADDARAQTLSAEEMVQQKDNWNEWAAEERKLQITGRYDGGLGRQFRLKTLEIRFNSERGTELPEKMQADQRLTVSGRLRKAGDRFEFSVSRLIIGDTDRQRMAERALEVPESYPERLYALADEYAAVAKYYEDTALQADVATLRRRAVNLQRRAFSDDAAQLSSLADRAEALQLDARDVAAIRFQSLATQTTAKNFDRAAVLDRIRSQLPGWDDASQTVPAELEQSFLKNSVAAYDKASDLERRVLNRRFFRQVRLPDLQRKLAADGSNGLDLAAEARQELPEETAAIGELETAFLDFKLSQVRQLSRPQLQELSELLLHHDRGDDFQKAVNDWLAEQRDRFVDRGLSGILRTADEYLFAYERWKNEEHQQQGIDLLKQAWQVAATTEPKEAELIGQRLERYGWTRLHDRWMTTEQVKELPRTDIELAMREGRVVPGMSGQQVTRTLGEPQRIVRVLSSRFVQEIWVFGNSGSSGVSVVMKRLSRQAPDDARVFSVTQSGR